MQPAHAAPLHRFCSDLALLALKEVVDKQQCKWIMEMNPIIWMRRFGLSFAMYGDFEARRKSSGVKACSEVMLQLSLSYLGSIWKGEKKAEYSYQFYHRNLCWCLFFTELFIVLFIEMFSWSELCRRKTRTSTCNFYTFSLVFLPKNILRAWLS